VSDQPKEESAVQTAGHRALPRWVNWVQNNLLLTFLLLAEAYLLGDLMQRGWVQFIDRPDTWGVYHGVGVVLFFLAGATAAGIALRCSAAASYAFACRPRQVGSGLFNMLGLFAFGLCEVWASLSERSANLAPTPADRAVLEMLNIGFIPISPTVLIVALLFPFATIYSGFSQTPDAPVESAEARKARHIREEEEAEHKRRMAGKQGGAFGARLRSTFDAVTQAKEETPAADAAPDFQEETSGISDVKPLQFPVRKPVASRGDSNMITTKELQAHVLTMYGVKLSDPQAMLFIQKQKTARQLDRQGSPWAANKAATLRAARTAYGAQEAVN
jgi:hypothetical protein